MSVVHALPSSNPSPSHLLISHLPSEALGTYSRAHTYPRIRISHPCGCAQEITLVHSDVDQICQICVGQIPNPPDCDSRDPLSLPIYLCICEKNKQHTGYENEGGGYIDLLIPLLLETVDLMFSTVQRLRLLRLIQHLWIRFRSLGWRRYGT